MLVVRACVQVLWQCIYAYVHRWLIVAPGLFAVLHDAQVRRACLSGLRSTARILLLTDVSGIALRSTLRGARGAG